MYAEYSYTDHMGRLVAVRVNYPQFVNYKGTMGIHVDRQVVADCRKPVTCRLYSGDGILLSTVIDSMESYAARMSASGPLYESVIKFSDASHAYLHRSK